MNTAVPPVMGQVPIFFQHDFTSKPRQAQFPQNQLGAYPTVPILPSTPMYSRPGSACSPAPVLLNNGPCNANSSESPAVHNKPLIMLEAEFSDNPYFPTTPPLSTSGSAVGSPRTFDVLQTPMNPMFSGLDGFGAGVKPILEPVENSVLGWASGGSPPMTPGKSQLSAFLLCELPLPPTNWNTNGGFHAHRLFTP